MKKNVLFLLMMFAFGLSWHGNAQITIGPQSGVTSNIPIHGLYNYSYSQQIIYQSEINANGYITSISFFHSSGTSYAKNNDWTIYLGHTTKTQFTTTSDWISGTNLNEVFDGIVTFPASTGNFMEITFDDPFPYNGTDNLVVAVLEKSPSYSSMSFGKIADVANSNRSLYWSSDSVIPNPNAPPSTAKARYNYINNANQGLVINKILLI